jgi:hypothetical protein
MKYLCKRTFISSGSYSPLILEVGNFYECEYFNRAKFPYMIVTDELNHKRRIQIDDFYERFYTEQEVRKIKLEKLIKK